MSETCGRKKFGFHGFILLAAAVAAMAIAVGTAVGKPDFSGHCGPWGRHSALTADDMKDYSELFVKRFGRRVNASDEQKAALQKELDAAIPKALELQQRKKAVHDRMIEALGEDKVDRAKLESARQEALALAQEASGLLLDTAVKASDILTPAQRKELVAHIRKRHDN